MQTKTIAMILLIAVATIGAVGITIGAVTQSAQAQCPNHCVEVDPHGQLELPNHDQTGDSNSGGHA